MSAATAENPELRDVRPIIPTGSNSNWGMWVFGVVLLLGGLVLYNALSAAEEADTVPSVIAPSDAQGSRIASPAPLRTPERFLQGPSIPAQPAGPQTLIAPRETQVSAPPVILPVVPTRASEIPPPLPPLQQTEQLQVPSGPQVVFDDTARRPVAGDPAPRESEESDRVTATRLINPSRTVPQGTVIPAVLETALDSTRAGGVRALVQRDVSSFDGSRVLIQRGSRLYGEYDANLQPGQNRALVQWTRLVRPDGVTIALDSPSSDPLGRVGIRGRVDTKFLQRFGGALLQSVLDIGVGLAVNEASDGVIVALPGSTQNVQVTDQQSIRPTLKVRHGTSVSVFVARDLDFSSVDP